MSLDDLHVIEDFGPDTLLALALRIERSRTLEQLIYRESEIDEVWRLLGSSNATDRADGERLAKLREEIMTVHDLVGIDENTTAAASRLRAIAA